jgi:TetR/AcrR family transcriptional regulator, lmrAB and yxaGH operons repressor
MAFMRKGQSARAKLVDTAAALFMRQGYHGTGLAQIVAVSGAPKGSLYFHFPGGKEALVLAAVENAGSRFRAALHDVLERHAEPKGAVLALAAMLGQWMQVSNFVEGCPITTVCLELAPENALITAETNTIFASWQADWQAHLHHAGFTELAAASHATMIVAALEGAFILCRTEQSTRPLEVVGAMLAAMLDREDG